jgi:hypothetical protein
MSKFLDSSLHDTKENFFTAPSLAATLLFLGLGYACPLLLFPVAHPQHGPTSPEILNLYFLIAWMGIAHFIYAYHGQARTLLHSTIKRTGGVFVGCCIVGAVFLGISRHCLGLKVFDSLVWAYFIPHFIKAEIHFSQWNQAQPRKIGWVVY